MDYVIQELQGILVALPITLHVEMIQNISELQSYKFLNPRAQCFSSLNSRAYGLNKLLLFLLLLYIITTIKCQALKKLLCVCFILTQDLSNTNNTLQSRYYPQVTDMETKAQIK